MLGVGYRGRGTTAMYSARVGRTQPPRPRVPVLRCTRHARWWRQRTAERGCSCSCCVWAFSCRQRLEVRARAVKHRPLDNVSDALLPEVC